MEAHILLLTATVGVLICQEIEIRDEIKWTSTMHTLRFNVASATIAWLTIQKCLLFLPPDSAAICKHLSPMVIFVCNC